MAPDAVALSFEVTVASSLVSNIGITNSGKLYEVNDTITIASGSFGGTTDLVLTVTELQPAPMVYGNYNKTIQRRFDGTPLSPLRRIRLGARR